MDGTPKGIQKIRDLIMTTMFQVVNEAVRVKEPQRVLGSKFQEVV